MLVLKTATVKEEYDTLVSAPKKKLNFPAHWPVPQHSVTDYLTITA